MMDYCEKHGEYSTFCRYCDIEALALEEQRMEMEREERRRQEEQVMSEHFRKHPHG